jgi:uncharacterized protein
MTSLAFRFATTALAAFLIAGPAAAQQRPPATPAPQPARQNQQFTPSHLAAARDVAIGSGITRSFDAIAPQFYDQIKQNALTRPEIGKDLDQVLEALKPEMEMQKQQMVATAARIFATRMSEAELKDVVAFFKSPSGVKYVQAQPLVLDDLVVEMERWTQGVADYLMVRTRAEMGKRGHQLQ